MDLDHHLVQACPLDEGRLDLRFSDGTHGVLDLGPHLAAGGVFAPLRNPDEFMALRLARRGRSLEWPCGVDLCADALWMELKGTDWPSA